MAKRINKDKELLVNIYYWRNISTANNVMNDGFGYVLLL